jgi:S-formylglutathione hydrolase FrmB
MQLQHLRFLGKLSAVLSCLCLTASSVLAWGGEGHYFVGTLAVRSLPDSPLKRFWMANENWLAVNSSYPDRWRNRPDNAEGPRHFLDGENFGHGTDLTKIPRSFADTLKIRTYEQLRTDGVIPWTVARHYKLLVVALREKRWEDAMIQSAYMSHYIADSHVPFHASVNYDGQLSQPSQKGIHSRFETQTLQRTIQLTDLKTGEPLPVKDPITFTFDALQDSINLVEGILQADKEAVAKSGGEYNESYWEAFLPKSRPIAVARLERGGRALAGMLLAAWNEAQRPDMPNHALDPDSLLPYAPIFVPRGEKAPTVPTPIPDHIKMAAKAEVQTIKVMSKALGKETSVNVILPEGYNANRARYSVLYLLHGASGNYTDWATKSGVAAYARTRPFIVVMPDADGDSFYINTPGKGKVADYILQELIPAIDQKYRTIAMREGRAIAGLSMGGYGAWRIALGSPGTFQCTASLSGALGFGRVGPEVDEGLKRFLVSLYGANGTPEMLAKEALSPMVKSLLVGERWTGPALYFDIGKDDFLLASNREMESELMQLGVPYEFSEFNGGHTWEYWDEHIRDVFQFIERQVRKPMMPTTATATQTPTSGEWVSLFDGKTLTGWKRFASTAPIGAGWVVEEGILTKKKGVSGGNIVTEATFLDFELEWDWRIAPGGNSGVKYLVSEKRPGAPGHEYQMLDSKTVPPKHQTASFYDVLPPTIETSPKAAGEWNQSKVLVAGNRVEHWLNGVKVLEYQLGSPEVNRAIQASKFKNASGFGEKVRGPILLTDHNDECSFRNIRIRAL